MNLNNMLNLLVGEGLKIKDIVTFGEKITLNPEKKPEYYNWGQWQILLKRVALYNQEDKCLFCDKYLKKEGHLHHCLIPKSRVRGIENKWLIHHSFNVSVCHPDCHIENPEKWAYLMQSVYPLDALKNWYFNFPVKTRLADIF